MEPKPELDAKDWQLLEALRRDARLGDAELARTMRLSALAVAERMKRLEEASVINGYRATVNPKRLGYGIGAMVRLRCDGITCARIGALVEDIPEVLETRPSGRRGLGVAACGGDVDQPSGIGARPLAENRRQQQHPDRVADAA